MNQTIYSEFSVAKSTAEQMIPTNQLFIFINPNRRAANICWWLIFISQFLLMNQTHIAQPMYQPSSNDSRTSQSFPYD